MARACCAHVSTWDCGYAAPAATMQYTSTSFAQPLTKGAALFLRPETRAIAAGCVPNFGHVFEHDAGLGAENFIAPFLKRRRGSWVACTGFNRVVQWYVFYVVAALTALLIWMVGHETGGLAPSDSGALLSPLLPG